MTDCEMVRWHHQLNGLEFEQTQGDSEGQRSLVCCSPWGCKKESYDKPRQRIKKQRYHFANKGLYGQSYDFFSSHVQM